MNDIDILREIISSKRKHAPYFHFKNDKAGTERSAANDWLYARLSGAVKGYSYTSTPTDPPDIIVRCPDSQSWGVEITEMVDEETIRAQEKGYNSDWKTFPQDVVLKWAQTIVDRKSRKTFKGGPYSKKVLVICSDEESLFDASLCGSIKLNDRGMFDEVWLMIPPEPNMSGGPPKNPYCQIFAC